jgi:2'-5' RNA ligase
MMEEIRAFIAVELPPDFKLALARLQERLKSGSRAPVKWVDPAIIHLTLKFLGNIDSALTGRITDAIREAARGIHPFRVEMGGLGVFPSPGRVRVVWVGLAGDVDKLAQLQKRLDSALAPLGFSPESRPFTPHLTLARVRDNAATEQRQELGRLVTATPFEVPGSIRVDALHLMRSQLTREGPVYTRISSVALA